MISKEGIDQGVMGIVQHHWHKATEYYIGDSGGGKQGGTMAGSTVTGYLEESRYILYHGEYVNLHRGLY